MNGDNLCVAHALMLLFGTDIIFLSFIIKEYLIFWSTAQIELYADYDPKMLLPFLRSSQHYTLEKVRFELVARFDSCMHV